MTLRPNRSNLLASIFLLLVVAGGELWGAAYQILVLQREPGVAWFLGTSAVFLIALVVGSQKAYIRVDDSVITFGPKLPGRRSFDRREVVGIRASHSPLTRRTVFLRSDGSTLYSTPGVMWGRDGLQRLADYLGVPLEWQMLHTYSALGSWITVKEASSPSNSFVTPFDMQTPEPVERIWIAIMPVAQPWETASAIEFGAWNECPTPEEHMVVMRYWFERWGAEPVAITSDTGEDIVTQGIGTIEGLAATLLEGKTWFFWWD